MDCIDSIFGVLVSSDCNRGQAGGEISDGSGFGVGLTLALAHPTRP